MSKATPENSSRIGLRNVWGCRCGAKTWALQQDEHNHLVEGHLRPDGTQCDTSETTVNALSLRPRVGEDVL